MKKILVTPLLLSVALYAQTVDLNTIKKLKIFNGSGIQLQALTKHESLYHVKGITRSNNGSTPFNAYLTLDLKEVVIGQGFNTNTEKALKISMDTKEYLKDAAYTIGTGKDEYIVFTDPECPYCVKLENILPKMKGDAKFHVFLYPLSFHKNAKSMSFYIMSQNTEALKQEAAHKTMNGDTSYKNAKFSLNEIEEYESNLKKMKNFANYLGASATPSVYTIDGNSIQWNLLIDKYNIEKPIDIGGIEFLKNNNLLININQVKNKPTMYIFSDLANETNIKKLALLLKKNEKTHNVVVALRLDNNKKSMKYIKAIYSLEKNKERVNLLRTIILSNKLSLDEEKRIALITKDEETTYIPVAFIMQKMGFKNTSGVVTLVGTKVTYEK